MKKPNILLVMCDQMNPLLTSIMKQGAAKMPHLDRMAEEGTVFERAYCNSPLCVPSRASMMSGRLISNIRCAYDNGSVFNPEIPCFTHMLNEQGYKTVLSGKMHFIGPDQLHGFQERLTHDVYPEDLICTPEGFGKDPESHVGYGRKLYEEIGANDWNNQVQYDEETHIQALKRIRKFAHDEEQFFMTVSYTNPHSPFEAPQRFFDLYEDEEIELPEISEDIEGSLDFYNAYLAHDFGFYKPSEAVLRKVIRSYYAQCSYIDEKLGQLREALQREGLTENTIVIFTSDHAEMMGRKGMFEKRTFFEDSVRVPLVVFDPRGRKMERIRQNVSLVDLFPTLADWTGSDWPRETLDGQSLVPLLQGEDVENRAVVTEYYGESIVTPFRALVQGDLKYVHFPEREEEDMLFDLSKDNEETENVIAVRDYVDQVEQLRTEVRKGLDYDGFACQIEQSTRDRKLVLRGVLDKSERPWRHFPDIQEVMWHWLPEKMHTSESSSRIK